MAGSGNLLRTFSSYGQPAQEAVMGQMSHRSGCLILRSCDRCNCRDAILNSDLEF